MSKSNGGPAFPSPAHYSDQIGMSLRDWFAGQMLPAAFEMAMTYSRETSPAPMTARVAYEVADAMLAVRETPDREEQS